MTDHFPIGSQGDEMPTISVEQQVIAQILARHGIQHDIEKLENDLPLLGTDIDSCDEQTLDIEIFPDRPDLLSGETLAHSMLPFLYDYQPNPTIPSIEGNLKMVVHPELSSIRPVIYAAVVRNVTLDDAAIKRLMDHQEKLHFSIGRRRKRASIGVHDLAQIQAPFDVRGVPRDTKFIPLSESREMTIDEILNTHPKGVAYAHLLENLPLVPIIEDKEGKILSFPPIINGAHTTVKSSTKDILVDVTGWDKRACETAILLICLQLSTFGGNVETVEVKQHDGEIWKLDTSPISHSITRGEIQKILGKSFSNQEIASAISRMGGIASCVNEQITIQMPRWRYDILHPVDLIEEIAIGHGYDDLGDDIAKAPLAGIPRRDAHLLRRLRSSIQGMGMLQVQSLTLSNDEDQFEKMRWAEIGEVTRIHNPITSEHTIMRQRVLPALIRLLAANKHHDLPQHVYELGTVVQGHENRTHLSFLVAEAAGGFASLRGRIQALMRDLGVSEYALVEKNGGPWLEGRAANIMIGNRMIGECGELDPHVGLAYDLRVPMNGAEIFVEELALAIKDPVTHE